MALPNELESIVLEIMVARHTKQLEMIKNARKEIMEDLEAWKNEHIAELKSIMQELEGLEKSAEVFELLQQSCLRLQKTAEEILASQ